MATTARLNERTTAGYEAVIDSLKSVDRSDLPFIDAIRVNMNDHLPKLVYADRLDELGESLRAELIRLEVARIQSPNPPMDRQDADRFFELTNRATGYDTDPPRFHAMFGFTTRLGIALPPWRVGREDGGLSMCNLNGADNTAFFTEQAIWPRQWSLAQMCGLFARNPVNEIRLWDVEPKQRARWQGRLVCFVDAMNQHQGESETVSNGVVVNGDAFELLAHSLRNAPANRGQLVTDGGRRRLAFPTRLAAIGALASLHRIATDVIRETLWPGKYPRTAAVFT